MRYNNYHKHTHYSNIRTLDCVVKPEDYMKRAVELGHITYFTTEHGFQGNIFESQTYCEKYNLNPIYGVEAYYADDILDHSSRQAFHIMLVAMTKKARYEINKIMSIANTDGFYYKPRIGLKELLSLTPEETIVTTACIASRLFKEVEGKDWYKDFFLPLKQHFGNNFYLEVQCHDEDAQKKHNHNILVLAKNTDTKIIHACDSHYILPEDSVDRDLFLNAKGLRYEEESGFILDYPDSDTIIERYKTQGILTEEQALEAINNTLIFDNAEPIYTDKEFKIPLVPNDWIKQEVDPSLDNSDNDAVLKHIIGTEFKKRVESDKISKDKIDKYMKEISDEVSTVAKCNMASYFVLDHMAVKRAVEHYGAVLTRSGRGSAVSFVINNFLGLTEVDRVKAPVRLYPSRFMSAERILSSKSLPDIDLNFSNVDPVIQATKDILGDDQIYYMVAYKPLQRSSAFRLYCKAMGQPVSGYDEAAKMLAEKSYTDDMFREQYPVWAPYLDHSITWRGVIESIAPSPCSFLLSNDPISEIVGLIKVGDQICCALDGYNCDVYKFLKNDYLTVSVYELISRVYKLIGRPIDDISTLVNNADDKVWNIYEKGLTTTINQADSDIGKKLVMRYKPKNLAELSAWVAAIRPGFASLIEHFLNREDYSTGVDELDSILTDSYHYMLYQESIMAFLVWLGIEEKGTYDIIKKIAKKKFKEEELNALKDTLRKNWIEKLGNDEHFDDNWQVVQDAASYSFNASHALSVAIDSLYGAYLKSHYPLEYFTVALSMYSGDIERTKNLTKELEYFGIKLKPVKFRYSGADYTMDKDTNSIYKGVGSVKFLNYEVSETLYKMKDQNFNTFLDILSVFPGNSRQLEILIKLNYFEEFGKTKKLLDICKVFDKLNGKKTIKKTDENEYLCDLCRKYATKETEKQFRFEDGIPNSMLEEMILSIPNKEIPIGTILEAEKEYMGYMTYTRPDFDDTLWIVTDVKFFPGREDKPYLSLYQLSSGKIIDTRMNKGNYYRENKFNLYSILKLDNCSFRECYKKKKQDDGSWATTDEMYVILEEYDIIKF